MLLLVTDENFNNDIVRVQEVGLRGADDPAILEWAANEGRVVLTHDAATMTYYAYERVRVGLSMSGVIEVADDLPLGQVIEDILLLAEYSNKGERESQVIYLPL